MPKKKQRTKSKSSSKAKKKASRRRSKKTALRKAKRFVETVATPEPTGACRYTDSFGQLQCESPVTKAYCDGRNGFFTEDGRC